MSLRRTGLERKTELRRTPMPRPRQKGASRPTPVSSKKRVDTGPDKATRLLVLDRAQGGCELCGVQLHDGMGWLRSHSVHHRRPRGMGGSTMADTNSPANLLLLCGDGVSGCHGRVESNRTRALEHGWLVPFAGDPAAVPVTVFGDVQVHLTHDGTYQEVS